MKVGAAIAQFMASLAQGSTEVYNESSLQHELGVFLRSSIPPPFNGAA